MTSPSIETPAGVDPAFTDPARPALSAANRPADGEVAALLTDRARLTAWLAGGYRLYRAANARTWASVATPGAATQADGTPDPSFGQRSNADARRAWLEHYAWLHAYGPTLLLLLDRALLDGAVEQAYRAARDGAEIQDL
ncbi:MAG TPA: hypothetical protein VK531_00855 [Gemmatimonadales bacterium]|nr:hypothetical protein [Gemmatimonadales bacterium]